jgi:hypothetical protein
MSPIALIIWLIIVLLIAGGVLGVVRAVLATPAFANLSPYTGVIYALIVLLVILVCVSLFTGYWGWGPTPYPRLR